MPSKHNIHLAASGRINFIFWFYLFAATLPILLYQLFFNKDKEDKENKYGYAKFANKKDVESMGLNFNDGIVLGKMGNDVIRSNQPLSTLIIAPTGTGKTAGFIIPTLKSINNSVIAFDIKGELLKKCAEDRKRLGQEIFVFGVDDVKAMDLKEDFQLARFNPFARNQLPENLRKIKSYVKNIANIIFDEKKPGSDKGNNYFNSSAKELFSNIALYLIAENGFTSITSIKALLLKDKDLKLSFLTIAEKVEDKMVIEVDEDRKFLLKQVMEGMNQIIQITEAKDQFLGVIGSLTTAISVFDDAEIQEIINHEFSSITADDLRKRKISLFLLIKDIDIERLRPLVTLFLESLVSDILSTQPEEQDNQITIILDEFGNLGKVSKLIKATTISRSYKLNQIFILQDLAQISSIYSNDEKSILEANTAYKVILQQNNFDTAKRISDLIGNRTETRISKSQKEGRIITNSKGSDTQLSSSKEGIPLVTTQDILNLNRDYCLIIAQGSSAKVIKAKIAWWFNG